MSQYSLEDLERMLQQWIEAPDVPPPPPFPAEAIKDAHTEVMSILNKASRQLRGGIPQTAKDLELAKKLTTDIDFCLNEVAATIRSDRKNGLVLAAHTIMAISTAREIELRCALLTQFSRRVVPWRSIVVAASALIAIVLINQTNPERAAALKPLNMQHLRIAAETLDEARLFSLRASRSALSADSSASANPRGFATDSISTRVTRAWTEVHMAQALMHTAQSALSQFLPDVERTVPDSAGAFYRRTAYLGTATAFVDSLIHGSAAEGSADARSDLRDVIDAQSLVLSSIKTGAPWTQGVLRGMVLPTHQKLVWTLALTAMMVFLTASLLDIVVSFSTRGADSLTGLVDKLFAGATTASTVGAVALAVGAVAIPATAVVASSKDRSPPNVAVERSHTPPIPPLPIEIAGPEGPAVPRPPDSTRPTVNVPIIVNPSPPSAQPIVIAVFRDSVRSRTGVLTDSMLTNILNGVRLIDQRLQIPGRNPRPD